MNKIAFEIYKIAAEIKYADLDKEAGLLDKLKKAVAATVLSLSSMFIFDDQAEAAKIKDPKKYGQEIENILNQYEEQGKVKIKVDEKNTGDVQSVKFDFYSEDGKKFGTINFLGSKSLINSLDAKVSTSASDYEKQMVKTVFESMENINSKLPSN